MPRACSTLAERRPSSHVKTVKQGLLSAILGITPECAKAARRNASIAAPRAAV
jgi:hypothetical protein